MKILVAAAEKAGLIDRGGVAQYVLGEVRALQRMGHEVKIAIPPYAYLQGLQDKSPVPEVEVVRLGVHSDFGSVSSVGGIYSPPSFERWVAFSHAVADYACFGAWRPNVIHCHDAHACMVPVFMTELRSGGNDVAVSIGTVLTIHNLLQQGKGSYDLFRYTGLPQYWYDHHFECYGVTNCYKAGLMTADAVTTVSRTYATEICSSEDFGFGLMGVLKALPRPITGVVNGIDEKEWSLHGLKYDGSDSISVLTTRKKQERNRLFPEWAWPSEEPLIAFKGRWDRQKGIELIPSVTEGVLGKARVIFNTWPEPGSSREYVREFEGGEETVSHTVRNPFIQVWRELEALQRKYPLRLLLNAPGTTSEAESAALYTAADFFLMPSVYEPCGLAQMECQRFGCIPVVRKTGGLADTVVEDETESPNGFVFADFSKDDFAAALDRAVKAFHDKNMMATLLSNALQQRNGWDTRMPDYAGVFEDAMLLASQRSGMAASRP